MVYEDDGEPIDGGPGFLMPRSRVMRVEDLTFVCISLDRSVDRWNRISREAAVAGVPLQRMSAVDANTFDATTHPAVSVGTAQNIKNGSRRSHYEIDKAGAVGCSLSHFKAWSVAAGAGPVVIFEDDTHIPTDFIQRLSTVLADLPSHWDIVQFYNTRYEYGLKGCQPDPTGGPLSRCENIMGAFAYMISPEGARKMLRDAYPIELHVDAYMAYMARLGRVTVLWHPLIDILPTLGESTIEHGGGDILNVPTNMKRYGIVMMEKSTLASLMAGALLMGAFLAWGHRAGRKV